MGASRESPLVRVAEGLRKAVGEKEIPCSLLYDDRGSELYEQITELEEYYPFRVEERRLKGLADEIAAAIPEGSVIVELGCGTARKSSIVLTAVQKLRARCKYVGIDVSAAFLSEARSNLVAQGIAPECIEMVEGEYMQGLKQVRAMHPTANMCIMWLGSSVGNFSDEGANQFFRDISSAVGTRCQIFLCADMWKDKAKLYAAYHDKLGVTELFIKNGMRCALSLLGHSTTAPEEARWLYSVVVNQFLRRVEMYLTFTSPLSLPSHNIHIQQNERILVEVSRKFTISDFDRLANEAGFHIDVAWRDRIWGMQMLLPFRESLERCWASTDGFFAAVPDWCEKPIDVRHPFKFYYGHIQAFAKLKLRPEEGASVMDVMFSRGIDPNVVDPTKCHSHPEVPSEWPSRGEIEAYVQRTRSQLLSSVARGEIAARPIILALEHEYMHLETLAYMRAQERKATFEKKMQSKNSSSPSLQLSNEALAYRNGTTTTNGISNGAYHSMSNGAYQSTSNGANQSISDGQHLQSSSGAHKISSNGPNPSISNGHYHTSSNGTNPSISNGRRQTSPNGANPSILNAHHQTSANGADHNSNGPHESISNGANHSISNGVHKKAIFTNGAVNGNKSHNINDESMVLIPAGTVTLGGDPLPGIFLWDNEYPQLHTSIPTAFTVARTPVTIAEYLSFIKSNGYNQPRYWKPLDFDFFTRRNITIPATWSQINNDYYIHTSTTSHHWSSVANEPVYASLSEAEAYCSWKNGRVMTEAEYHMILEHEDDGDGAGGRAGVQMMRSGGWEWTSTLFEGFPGFEKMSEYPEYSSDFFDGSHFVLKGASDVTHRCMWRDSFRNFYQRQYPYVFAKFRVCRTAVA